MTACKDDQAGTTPRLVERGVDSLIQKSVSVHWLRISFPDKHLDKVVSFVSKFFNSKPNSGFGLWGYDQAYRWHNKIKIMYDTDDEKRWIHNKRAYLECPGRACDELTPSDLLLFIESFKVNFEGRGERIDIALDDFSRCIEPCDLQAIAGCGDFSRFRQYHIKQSRVKIKNGTKMVYDAIVFGSQKKGWEKQLEVYDKNLESKGKINAVRWEVKFRQDKADNVFTKLSETAGYLDAFAFLCGSIVIGSIAFIHRNGLEKNLCRLDEYEFWELLKNDLQDLRIRGEKKVNTVTGIVNWLEHQAAPNFAVLAKVFKSEKVFFSWILDLLKDGESRLNPNQLHIIEEYAGSLDCPPSLCRGELENRYINNMCLE